MPNRQPISQAPTTMLLPSWNVKLWRPLRTKRMGYPPTMAVKKALGKHYNTFKKIEGDVALREKIRAKTIADYVHSHDLAITKYQATGKKARTI